MGIGIFFAKPIKLNWSLFSKQKGLFMKKIILSVLSATFAFAADQAGTTGSTIGEDRLVPATGSSLVLRRSGPNFRGLNVERRPSGTITDVREPTEAEIQEIARRQAEDLAKLNKATLTVLNQANN